MNVIKKMERILQQKLGCRRTSEHEAVKRNLILASNCLSSGTRKLNRWRTEPQFLDNKKAPLH